MSKCPSCGYCPHCGRKDAQTNPFAQPPRPSITPGLPPNMAPGWWLNPNTSAKPIGITPYTYS